MKQKIIALSIGGLMLANISLSDYTMPPAKDWIKNYLQNVILTTDWQPDSIQTIKLYWNEWNIVVGSDPNNAIFINWNWSWMVGVRTQPRYALDINWSFSPDNMWIRWLKNSTVASILKNISNVVSLWAKTIWFLSNEFDLRVEWNKVFWTNGSMTMFSNLTIWWQNTLIVNWDIKNAKWAFKDATIEEEDLANQSIWWDRINRQAVTNDKIAPNAVSTNKLSQWAITTIKIKDRSVNTDKIQPGSIKTDNIAVDAITYSKIVNKTIKSDNVIHSQVQIRQNMSCGAMEAITHFIGWVAQCARVQDPVWWDPRSSK